MSLLLPQAPRSVFADVDVETDTGVDADADAGDDVGITDYLEIEESFLVTYIISVGKERKGQKG
jgi:hypothetical protein